MIYKRKVGEELMKKGNFIDQMFIYTVLRKFDNTIQKYGGIHEVVQGEFAQNRANKKYETHIEKVLEWTIKNKHRKEVSHFSLQGHFTYLDKQNRTMRTEELDDRYYPFVLEFESSDKKKEYDVYYEVAVYIQHMLQEYNVVEKDIAVTITNSKSVYVWINPKVFGLRPGKNVHKIYTEMYKKIKKELGLKFVDESVVLSSYRLIKTPGSFYNGGFVNYINLDELMYLMTGELTREELTKNQRDIRQLFLPGIQSLKLVKLYETSKKKVEQVKKHGNNKEQKVLELPGKQCRECVKVLLNMPLIEKGNRNNFLVTIALGLLEANYDIKEIEKILIEKAMQWGHDENIRAVVSKIKSLIRNNTKFSCDKVKMLFEEEALMLSCNACKKAINSIYISRSIIESIYKNKGSVRHFRAYLELESKCLLGNFFSINDLEASEKTIKELAKKTNGKLEKKTNGLYRLTIKRGRSIYRLPVNYIENAANVLEQKLGKVLMLIVKAYSSNRYGAFISLSVIKMTEYLGFKNERSIYTFLKELENLGFLTKNKNGITIYYKSRKVINLNEEKENRKSNTEENKVVNGVQIKLDLNIEPSANIQQISTKINKYKCLIVSRGSPS